MPKLQFSLSQGMAPILQMWVPGIQVGTSVMDGGTSGSNEAKECLIPRIWKWHLETGGQSLRAIRSMT